MPGGDYQIVGEPSGIPRLPIDTSDSPELSAESVRARQDVEQKAGRHRILVMEPGAAGQLNRRFLFYDVLGLLLQVACSFSDLAIRRHGGARR